MEWTCLLTSSSLCKYRVRIYMVHSRELADCPGSAGCSYITRPTSNCWPKILKTRGEMSLDSRAKARLRVALLPVSKGEFVFEYVKVLLLISDTTTVVRDRQFRTSGCFFNPLVLSCYSFENSSPFPTYLPGCQVLYK